MEKSFLKVDRAVGGEQNLAFFSLSPFFFPSPPPFVRGHTMEPGSPVTLLPPTTVRNTFHTLLLPGP